MRHFLDSERQGQTFSGATVNLPSSPWESVVVQDYPKHVSCPSVRAALGSEAILNSISSSEIH